MAGVDCLILADCRLIVASASDPKQSLAAACECLGLGRPDSLTNLWFMLRKNANARASRYDDPLTLLLGVPEARVFFLRPPTIEDLKDGIT